MQLPRHARRWLNIEVEITDADDQPVTGSQIEASFDDGTTWHAADTGGTWPRWLLDGPDYDPLKPGMPPAPDGVTPIRITGRTPYLVRAITAPEVEVAAGTIYLA